MPGQLTLGGMAAGLQAGEIVIGPATMAGKRQEGEVLSLNLEANVDKKVTVPSEATAFAVLFTFSGSESPEVKLRTDKNETDTGFPLPAQGFFASPLLTAVKTLIFKSASVPKTFQVVFIV